MRKITHLVLHGTDSDKSTAASIRRFHMSKGWFGPGYHVGFPSGGGVDALRPEHKPGAHTAGFNKTTLAGVLYGDLDEHPPTTEQWDEAVRKFADWCEQHALDPHVAILGHRETWPFVPRALITRKSCPGWCVDMRAFRSAVARELEGRRG